ncbi:MAG: DUF4402 domain-containing protein [Novosphingobium sp.]
MCVGAIGLLAAPGAAFAAPGGQASLTGTANATLVRAISIAPVTDLRFGVIAAPTTPGTITVSPGGATTESGSMAGALAISQGAVTRGPAAFAVSGDPARLFSVTLPTTIAVSAGSAVMAVSAFTSNHTAGSSSLDPAGKFTLAVGATLSVAAGQFPGKYSGTYSVTAAYQ